MLAIGTSAFDPISAATAARELPVGAFCKIRSSCAMQRNALFDRSALCRGEPQSRWLVLRDSSAAGPDRCVMPRYPRRR